MAITIIITFVIMIITNLVNKEGKPVVQTSQLLQLLPSVTLMMSHDKDDDYLMTMVMMMMMIQDGIFSR